MPAFSLCGPTSRAFVSTPAPPHTTHPRTGPAPHHPLLVDDLARTSMATVHVLAPAAEEIAAAPRAFAAVSLEAAPAIGDVAKEVRREERRWPGPGQGGWSGCIMRWASSPDGELWRVVWRRRQRRLPLLPPPTGRRNCLRLFMPSLLPQKLESLVKELGSANKASFEGALLCRGCSLYAATVALRLHPHSERASATNPVPPSDCPCAQALCPLPPSRMRCTASAPTRWVLAAPDCRRPASAAAAAA